MKKILFVCSGNTDRSPMAACLANDLISRRGIDATAVSAGMAAPSNQPAGKGAIAEMERRGLSLRDHKSQPVCAALLEGVDLIVTMEERLSWLMDMFYPGCGALHFSPSIRDPHGGSPDDYHRCAEELLAHLPAFLDKLEGKE